MKEVARLRVDSFNDRHTICGILVENGYLCSVEQTNDELKWLISSWVVVYEKEDK